MATKKVGSKGSCQILRHLTPEDVSGSLVTLSEVTSNLPGFYIKSELDAGHLVVYEKLSPLSHLSPMSALGHPGKPPALGNRNALLQETW